MTWWRAEYHGGFRNPRPPVNHFNILVIEGRVAAVSIPDQWNTTIGVLWSEYKEKQEKQGWKIDPMTECSCCTKTATLTIDLSEYSLSSKEPICSDCQESLIEGGTVSDIAAAVFKKKRPKF